MQGVSVPADITWQARPPPLFFLISYYWNKDMHPPEAEIFTIGKVRCHSERSYKIKKKDAFVQLNCFSMYCISVNFCNTAPSTVKNKEKSTKSFPCFCDIYNNLFVRIHQYGRELK